MRAMAKFVSLAMVAALSLGVGGMLLGAGSAEAQTAAPAAAPAGAQDPCAVAAANKQPYTMAEYNAYTAAAAEKNPASQIKPKLRRAKELPAHD